MMKWQQAHTEVGGGSVGERARDQMGSVGGWARLHCDLVCVLVIFHRLSVYAPGGGFRGSVPGPEGLGVMEPLW